MTTPRVVTNALHRGDWAVSIDLKDAYFHVPIHAKSKRLLRFALTDSNGAPCIPIPSPSVWSDFGSTNIYKGNTPVGASSAHAPYQSAPISGRLADKKSRQVITLPAERLAARGHASSGVRVKRSKIPLNTYSTHHAHRRGIPSRLRSNVSPDDASSEV